MFSNPSYLRSAELPFSPNGAKNVMWIQVQKLLFWLRSMRATAIVASLLCGLQAGELQAQSAPKIQAPDALTQFNHSVEALVKKVSPSVVQVLVTGFKPLDEGSHSEASMILGKQRGIGSGTIIDSDGYIVTNAHVVTGAERVQVVLSSGGDEDASVLSALTSPGRTLDAHVVGVSNELDLALLKVEVKGLPALPIGKYERLQQGEIVFTFGSPSGLRNSVSMGVVSAVARQLDPDSPLVFIQTDAAINPGNSGGPLVDVDGELVGINTFLLSQSGGNEALGFAVPSAIVSFAYPQLRQYGHLHRGVIGIHVQSISPGMAAGLKLSRDWGVVIGDVFPGSPADKAGLKVQDIILTVNGRPVDSLPLFGISFFLVNPGEHVKMEVLRGSEKLAFDVTVIEHHRDVDRLFDMADPENNLVRKLGIVGLDVNAKILPLLPGIREDSGVVVVAKMATGGAENSLVTADIIHALNGVAINNLESLSSALDRLKPGSYVVLQVEREARLYYMTFQVD
jgi:serine protease Do